LFNKKRKSLLSAAGEERGDKRSDDRVSKLIGSKRL
jgi:hypothetical protein